MSRPQYNRLGDVDIVAARGLRGDGDRRTRRSHLGRLSRWDVSSEMNRR